jgi:predicted transcriptional regulator
MRIEIKQGGNGSMDTESSEPVLVMLKTLADESRLALLRLLNQEEHTVGDLAQQLDLGEPTISHHLSKLREMGFVTLRMAGNQRYYRVNENGLARFKKLVAEIEHMPVQDETGVSDDQWIAALGWDAEDQQVLREHTRDGKLTHLPTKQKKLLIILRWLATLFQAERMYTESEVNAVLKAVFEEDYVSLRRDLVDLGYLRRERGGGKYWLAPTEKE